MAILTERRLEGELMDDPALPQDAHAQALRGLRRVNFMSRTAGALWPEIKRVAANREKRRLSLLDVACGGGEVAIALASRARRRGIELAVSGCDISRTAVRHATANAHRRGASVDFFQCDVLREPLPADYDVIIVSLFLHHLTNDEIVALLRRLAGHGDHVLASDLLRGLAGYLLAWGGTRLLTRSHIVHVDGLRSIRAALTLAEARTLAASAGLRGVRFRQCWPRRFLMTWSRSPDGAPA